MHEGSDVGVEDYWLHGSGDLAVAFGVRERQELFEFLVGLEGVCGQIIE